MSQDPDLTVTASAAGRRPIDVKCPTCGAQPGRQCDWHGTSGRSVGSHWNRHAAAIEAIPTKPERSGP